MPGRSNHGGDPEEKLARNAPRPGQVFGVQGMRNCVSNASSHTGPRLQEVQRLRMHPLHGLHRRMSRRGPLAKVPLDALRYPMKSVSRFWSRGWELNPLAKIGTD